jgi:hypothetical protein
MAPPTSACDRELVSALGKLEGVVASLVTQVSNLDGKIEPIKLTCQRFEDYREARRNLPDKIDAVDRNVAQCQSNCSNHTEDTKAYYKKTDYLMAWSYKVAGIVIAVNVIVGAIVLLVELGVIKPW